MRKYRWVVSAAVLAVSFALGSQSHAKEGQSPDAQPAVRPIASVVIGVSAILSSDSRAVMSDIQEERTADKPQAEAAGAEPGEETGTAQERPQAQSEDLAVHAEISAGTLLKPLTEALDGAVQEAGTAVSGFAREVVIQDTVNPIVSIGQAVPQTVQDKVSKAAPRTVETLPPVLDPLLSAVEETVDSALETAGNTVEAASGSGSAMIGAVKDTVSTLTENLPEVQITVQTDGAALPDELELPDAEIKVTGTDKAAESEDVGQSVKPEATVLSIQSGSSSRMSDNGTDAAESPPGSAADPEAKASADTGYAPYFMESQQCQQDAVQDRTGPLVIGARVPGLAIDKLVQPTAGRERTLLAMEIALQGGNRQADSSSHWVEGTAGPIRDHPGNEQPPAPSPWTGPALTRAGQPNGGTSGGSGSSGSSGGSPSFSGSSYWIAVLNEGNIQTDMNGLGQTGTVLFMKDQYSNAPPFQPPEPFLFFEAD
ncbi:hypothetical protein [Paenibacillus physcomitrellae]|uniref:Secreted protein n=1 Tax=Paenibacillus physcomitrellae TaxID=1619311 RepID=A0ABQ1FY89_9BACL|nr:hypothetical protein [Paenibacillus physcomitrellae]GGA32882.1 hypothetical protein GCM10010917_17440 [Paenibacillus physcomitrellae]